MLQVIYEYSQNCNISINYEFGYKHWIGETKAGWDHDLKL